jgi:putative oxidoreductase
MTARGLTATPARSRRERLEAWVRGAVGLLERLPHDAIALLARLSIAGLFWRSGQTKIEGFALDPLLGRFELGWPRFAPFTVDLFRDEYRVPLLSAELAALLAAWAEHLFPVLLVLGLATRFAALALLGMTAVIQLFVYPDAWPTHGTWAVSLLYLAARGPGRLSLDHGLFARRGT